MSQPVEFIIVALDTDASIPNLQSDPLGAQFLEHDDQDGQVAIQRILQVLRR